MLARIWQFFFGGTTGPAVFPRVILSTDILFIPQRRDVRKG